VPPAVIAEMHNSLGEVDEAVRWLEQAYAERANHISYIRPAPGEPGMIGHPRIIALHRAAGLP
jgi:hypothetical protein